MLPTIACQDGRTSPGHEVHGKPSCVGTVQLRQGTRQLDRDPHECPAPYALLHSCIRRLLSRFTLVRLSDQLCAEFPEQTQASGTRKGLSLAVLEQAMAHKDYCRFRPGQDVRRPFSLLGYSSLAGNWMVVLKDRVYCSAVVAGNRWSWVGR